MPLDQFLKIYNQQLHSELFRIMDFVKHGDMSLIQLYRDIGALEDKIAPLKQKQDRLLAIAERYWIETGVL